MRAAIAAILGLLFWVPVGTAQVSPTADPAQRDFIEYWTAGHLLINGHNPYDKAALLELERAQGWKATKGLLPRNPPWALWLMLPLGLLSFSTGWPVWMTVCVAVFLISVRSCWH